MIVKHCIWIVFCKMIKNVNNIIEKYPEIYIYLFLYLSACSGVSEADYSDFAPPYMLQHRQNIENYFGKISKTILAKYWKLFGPRIPERSIRSDKMEIEMVYTIMPQNIAGNSFSISFKTLIEMTKTHSNELANEKVITCLSKYIFILADKLQSPNKIQSQGSLNIISSVDQTRHIDSLSEELFRSWLLTLYSVFVN